MRVHKLRCPKSIRDLTIAEIARGSHIVAFLVGTVAKVTVTVSS